MSTPRRVYVGIPVNEYQHFDSLKFCVEDAWNVASLLKLRGQYSEVHVLTEATASAMLVKLRKVVATLRSGDVLVLHLALHGVLDKKDDHVYLLGAADERFDPEHCLALSLLRSEVGSVDGLDVVLLVDACRGALGYAPAKVDSARKVSVVLDRNREAARDGGVQRTRVRRARFTEVFACSDHELAHELPALKQGLFTRAFLDVLAARERQRVPLAIDSDFESALVQQMRKLAEEHASELRVTPNLKRCAGHVPVLVADWPKAVVPPRPALRWLLAIVVLGAAGLGYFGWHGIYRPVGAQPSPGNAQETAQGGRENSSEVPSKDEVVVPPDGGSGSPASVKPAGEVGRVEEPPDQNGSSGNKQPSLETVQERTQTDAERMGEVPSKGERVVAPSAGEPDTMPTSKLVNDSKALLAELDDMAHRARLGKMGAGPMQSERSPSPLAPPRDVSWWAEVLEVEPDPKVVTDADVRRRIQASGWPWRVREKQSGIVLLLVPAGDFMMGSPTTEEPRASIEVLHRRVIRHPFYLGESKVCQAEWQRVMGGNPSRFRGPQRPVNCVDWHASQQFLDRVGLRLPSEAEWEYACRAGTATPFAYGEEYDWMRTGVQSREGYRNAWGLKGMHDDRVDEWCEDIFVPYPAGGGDESAAVGDSRFDRASRGGRSASRGGHDSSTRSEFVGFRATRSLR